MSVATGEWWMASLTEWLILSMVLENVPGNVKGGKLGKYLLIASINSFFINDKKASIDAGIELHPL